LSQKFPSAGGGSMLVGMLTSHLSFQTNAVKCPLVITLMSPLFNFSCFGPKSQGMSFLLGHTVLHKFILQLSKSLKSLGDEKKLSTNILCPKPSTLLVKMSNSCVCCSHVVSGGVGDYPRTISCHMYTLIHHRVCKL